MAPRKSDSHWTTYSACLSLDPETFFPVGEKIGAVLEMERARQVCLTCPVRTPCLELALELDAQFGMWGGTTPLERKRIVRRSRKKKEKLPRFVARRRPAAERAAADRWPGSDQTRSASTVPAFSPHQEVPMTEITVPVAARRTQEPLAVGFGGVAGSDR